MSDFKEQFEKTMNAVDENIQEFARQINAGVDEPELPDGEGRLDEYPLEVVNEAGKPYAVVISTGGPHIEVVVEGNRAHLAGYWGDEKPTRYGDHYDTFLDFFIER